MYGTQRDIICGGSMLLLLALYGLWITIKAMKQIREPTHIRDLGMGWFVSLVTTFTGQEDASELDRSFSTPVNVRLAAGCTLIAGVSMLAVPIVVWILVSWVLP